MTSSSRWRKDKQINASHPAFGTPLRDKFTKLWRKLLLDDAGPAWGGTSSYARVSVPIRDRVAKLILTINFLPFPIFLSRTKSSEIAKPFLILSKRSLSLSLSLFLAKRSRHSSNNCVKILLRSSFRFTVDTCDGKFITEP